MSINNMTTQELIKELSFLRGYLSFLNSDDIIFKEYNKKYNDIKKILHLFHQKKRLLQ